MKNAAACAILLLACSSAASPAQNLTTSSLATPAKARKKPPEKDPLKAAVAGGAPLPADQPTVTEIYADQAFFDSANHIGIFTGHVIVNDVRFNMQSDKLTIYLSKEKAAKAGEEPAEKTDEPKAKGEQDFGDSLEKAVAEGNVGVVRERPGENGAAPVRSVGRSDIGIYTTKDGNMELRGNPRVQSGLNTHIATAPETVMVINQSGQLTTQGPSRTEIRQEPKVSPSPAPAPVKKP